jgi:uncharacterized membrane protein
VSVGPLQSIQICILSEEACLCKDHSVIDTSKVAEKIGEIRALLAIRFEIGPIITLHKSKAPRSRFTLNQLLPPSVKDVAITSQIHILSFTVLRIEQPNPNRLITGPP